MKRREFHQVQCQHEFTFHALRDRKKTQVLDPKCPPRYKAVTVTVVVSPSGHYELGWACCNEGDSYSRRLGRAISRGRALKILWGRHYSFPAQEVDRKAAKMSAFKATTDFLELVGRAIETAEHDMEYPPPIRILLDGRVGEHPRGRARKAGA